MATLPDGHADLLVTSPPFLALRSYLPADHPDKHREIGSEPTPAAFIDTLLGLTADWGRLVPEWGSICVELGDTMSGSGGASGDYYNADGLRAGQAKFSGSAAKRAANGVGDEYRPSGRDDGWPLAKSMCLAPHLYTIGLAYGHNPLTGGPSPAGQWRIRNVITWARPNPPVGSLGKRNPAKRTGDYKFRPACSYITVACRGTGRYFDLDAVRHEPVDGRYSSGGGSAICNGVPRAATGDLQSNPAGAPPLDWHTDGLDGDWLWKLATAPYPGSHYATYPLTLPRRLVLAMCPSRVCTVCGWPSERITGDTTYVQTRNGAVPAVLHMREAQASGQRRRTDERVKGAGWIHGLHGRGDASVTASAPTLGWTDCGHDAWRPGMVLDPFGGSGTTAVAAALEGRDATLIDLDHRNVDLVRRRILDHLRIVDEHRDGDTITWTVETAAPNQRAQVNGQTSMLDLFNA
jgi:site-specific DNA-methyltransferase (cytosine-N4-specific)